MILTFSYCIHTLLWVIPNKTVSTSRLRDVYMYRISEEIIMQMLHDLMIFGSSVAPRDFLVTSNSSRFCIRKCGACHLSCSKVRRFVSFCKNFQSLHCNTQAFCSFLKEFSAEKTFKKVHDA